MSSHLLLDGGSEAMELAVSDGCLVVFVVQQEICKLEIL